MIEATMRKTVVRLLKSLHAVPVENVVGPGTPDVNCTAGWIELKSLAAWPARASTIVRVPTFTPQQRIWLQRRVVAGGRAWVLLSVGREWLLFEGGVASQSLGELTCRGLEAVCLCRWDGTPPERELVVALTGPP